MYWAAQTTLRDVMGAVNIAQLSTRRSRSTVKWPTSRGARRTSGASVVSVEIRDIEIPDELQVAVGRGARRAPVQRARHSGRVEKEIWRCSWAPRVPMVAVRRSSCVR
ncbi:MAG: hypothetical protein ACLSVD_10190 [Eggerthellaceae bacterium]